MSLCDRACSSEILFNYNLHKRIMKDAVIILCGGGPAPGMNSVSMSVAKTVLTKNFRVIGLHGGYSGLFSKNARTEDLTFAIADRYFN